MMSVRGFGERLRAARAAKGLSLRSLAKLSGINYSHISKLERQKNSPLAVNVEALANALGMSSSELLSGHPDRRVDPLPLVPGMEQQVVASYPVVRRTALKAGESRKLSTIARASASWTALVVRGILRLRGRALDVVVSAGAKINRDVLVRLTVWADAEADSELLWVEEARQPEASSYSRPELPEKGTVLGYVCSNEPAADTASTISELERAGCIAVYCDAVPNHSQLRCHLVEVLQRLRPGDTLIIPSLSAARLRTHELLELMNGLIRAGITLVSLDGSVDTRQPGATALVTALAKLEPNPRSSRVSAGVLAANDGQPARRGGRPPALSRADLEEIRAMVDRGFSNAEIRRHLEHPKKSTLERYLRQVREGQPTALEDGNSRRKTAKRIGRPAALSPEQVEQLRALLLEGLSAQAIRDRLGLSKTTIGRYARRIREGVQ